MFNRISSTETTFNNNFKGMSGILRKFRETNEDKSQIRRKSIYRNGCIDKTKKIYI